MRWVLHLEMEAMNETCAFAFVHDDDLNPVGPLCGRQATQVIYWVDGRWSPSCDQHGYSALEPMAKALVERIEQL